MEFTDKSLPRPSRSNAKRLRKTEFRLRENSTKASSSLAAETAMEALDADDSAQDDADQVGGDKQKTEKTWFLSHSVG